MIARLLVVLSTLGCVSVLAGCDPDNPCDEGYFADHGFCYLIDASTDWQLDSGIDLDDAGMIEQNPDATYGTPCTSQSECGGVAPVCGGPMLPLCTTINCETAGCPSGWNCIDVTKYPGVAPGVMSVCIQL